MLTRSALTLVTVAGFSAVGCNLPKKGDADDRAPITKTQASQALEATAESNEAGDLLNASTEISTHFTLGQAAEKAAAELRTFVESQLPCADVTVDGTTLTVEYGAKPGVCTYRGQTFSGTHSMHLVRFDATGAEVEHTWTKFSNGKVVLDGTADVTWTKADTSFRAVEQYAWTRTADGRSFTAEADQTVGGLGGDWTHGVTWEGKKSWEGDRGKLSLVIEDVEARWIDPVPQAGTMTVSGLPEGAASLGFRRIDDDTIRVTIEGGGKSFAVDVNRLGASEPVDGDAS
jgi:hypothetical protein